MARWAGLGRRYPIVGIVFSLFLLAFAGIPLTSGFVSKFAVFKAAGEGGAIPLVIVGVIASAIAAYFYVRVIVLMFFTDPPDDAPDVVVPSILTTAVVTVTAADHVRARRPAAAAAGPGEHRRPVPALAPAPNSRLGAKVENFAITSISTRRDDTNVRPDRRSRPGSGADAEPARRQERVEPRPDQGRVHGVDRGRCRRVGARGGAHRDRPRVLCGRRPQGGAARRARVLRGVPVAELHRRGREDAHTDHRGDQRCDVHRRAGDGAGLRLPHRLRAGGVRRHPRPRRDPARRRDDRAAPPARRPRHGPAAVDDRRGRRRRPRRDDRAGHRGRRARAAAGPRAGAGRARSPRCPAQPCWGSRRSTPPGRLR